MSRSHAKTHLEQVAEQLDLVDLHSLPPYARQKLRLAFWLIESALRITHSEERFEAKQRRSSVPHLRGERRSG